MQKWQQADPKQRFLSPFKCGLSQTFKNLILSMS